MLDWAAMTIGGAFIGILIGYGILYLTDRRRNGNDD